MLLFIWALCPNACACHTKMRHERDGLVYALVQWDDGYIFKLTLLACVNFPPHTPYILATFV